MKFALIQPADTSLVFRVLDGKISKTINIGALHRLSPKKWFDWLSGDDGWVSGSASALRNHHYELLASSDYEASARVVYQIPADVELYSSAEVEAIICDIPLSQRRTETVRFRCTPDERANLDLLAARYAGGNLSRLILGALQKAYPTL